MTKTKSKMQTLITALKKGRRLTSAKIREQYAIENPSSYVWYIRTHHGLTVQHDGVGYSVK